MPAQTHNCRICQGERPHDGKICQGCGTELVRCKPARVQRDGICPGCSHCGPHKQMELGRVRCLKCQAVFEAPDFGFLDDRPDMNIEKKERLEKERRKHAR